MARLTILSRGRSVRATNRLVEEAEAAGHRVWVIDPAQTVVVAGPRGRTLSSRGHDLGQGTDVVVPRLGSRRGDGAIAGIAQYEHEGVPVLNGSRALRVAGDKLRSIQVLAERGIPVPPTAWIRSASQLAFALRAVGGPPAVLKLRYGSQGVGVVPVRTADAADAVVQTVLALTDGVLVQGWVGPRDGGRDVRVLVVGGRPLGAIERRAPEGAFRANVHRGAAARAVTLDAELSALAADAATAVGLDVAGVDLVRDRSGRLHVLEANGSPGFDGFERATGLNVARAVVDLAGDRASGTDAARSP